MKKFALVSLLMAGFLVSTIGAQEQRAYLYLKGAWDGLEASIDLNNVTGTATDLQMQVNVVNTDSRDLALSERDTLVLHTGSQNQSIARLSLPAVVGAKSSVTLAAVFHIDNGVGFLTSLGLIAEVAKKHKGDPELAKFDPGIEATWYIDSIGQTIKLSLAYEYSAPSAANTGSAVSAPKDEPTEIEESLAPVAANYAATIAQWSNKSGLMDRTIGVHWDQVTIDGDSLVAVEKTGAQWNYHLKSQEFVSAYMKLKNNSTFMSMISACRIFGKMRGGAGNDFDVLLLSVVTPRGTHVMFESTDESLAARFR